MKTVILAAAAAAVAMTAGSAMAATRHKASAGATVESPARPIPYNQLEAYLSASPKERASNDWWSGASMGSAADTSASAGAPAPTDATTSSGAVNPPADSAAAPPAGAGTAPSTGTTTPAPSEGAK
jgi:hypothetical protein